MSAPKTSAPRREVQVGSWIKLPSPMSVEAVLSAGADFACIDMCNGCLSIETVCDLLAHPRSAGRRFVRLAADAPPSVAGQLLDAGADGIVVPHTESADHARRFVEASLFKPYGCRGMGSTGRRGNWGLDAASAYLASGRLDGNPPFLSVMIESVAALGCVDELAQIEGVSQLLVGTADLTLDLSNGPLTLREATERVARACAANGLSAGVAVGRPEDAEAYVSRGFDALYLSNDLSLLAREAQRNYRLVRLVTAGSLVQS